MRGLAGSIVGIIVCARAAVAHPPPPPPEEPTPARTMTVAEVGPWFAAEEVAHYSGLALGARLALGLRRDRMFYEVEGEGGSIWLTSRGDHALDHTIGGTIGRAGANARWTAGSIGGNDVSIDGWLEGGVGLHVIQWRDGGRLVRPDALVGVGLSERFGRTKSMSLDAGLLIVVGRGAGGGVPGCAGPCDEATPPVHVDLELIDHCAFTARW